MPIIALTGLFSDCFQDKPVVNPLCGRSLRWQWFAIHLFINGHFYDTAGVYEEITIPRLRHGYMTPRDQ
ncbi:MAG: hypothetical protein LAO23_11195 [Acidobacteriia bacterium]|nr:hypothetical protein [Terriglobia bacterium]